MMRNDQTERAKGSRAEEAVLAVFPRTVKVSYRPHDTFDDLIVNGQPLTIKWIGEGRLGDIRPILEQQRGRPIVAVARRMSPGARHALSEAGIGWVDETGAAEIAVGSIIVSRTGVPPGPDPGIKRWTPAVMAVAEALMVGVKATVFNTRSATGLSTGSCTNALRFLVNQGVLEANATRGRDSGRSIKSRRELLNAYATAVQEQQSPQSLQFGVTWRDPVARLAEVGKQWNRANITWAASGAVAASVFAPYFSTVTHAVAYVDANTIVGLESIAQEAELRPIKGGRLTLKPFPTVAVRSLTREIEGLRVAPWPRIDVDLREEGVRGEEAAEHLLEVIHEWDY
jgi:hypothetical protein